jgi:hypothetical protein
MLLLLSWIMVGCIYILSTNTLKREEKKRKERDDACYEFFCFYHSVL